MERRPSFPDFPFPRFLISKEERGSRLFSCAERNKRAGHCTKIYYYALPLLVIITTIITSWKAEKVIADDNKMLKIFIVFFLFSYTDSLFSWNMDGILFPTLLFNLHF